MLTLPIQAGKKKIAMRSWSSNLDHIAWNHTSGPLPIKTYFRWFQHLTWGPKSYQRNPKYFNYFLTIVYFLTTTPTTSSTEASLGSSRARATVPHPVASRAPRRRAKAGRMHSRLLQPTSDRSTGNAVVNWFPGFVSKGLLARVVGFFNLVLV